jgi:hypothetical protein
VKTLLHNRGPQARESSKTMTRRLPRNHLAVSKAKVILDAMRGDKTLAELAELHDLHPNQITDWKNQLLSLTFTMDEASGFGRIVIHTLPAALISPCLGKFDNFTTSQRRMLCD